jgi:hypothetical protein
VYTGVPIKGLTKFSIKTENRSSLTDILQKGIYFSNKEEIAKEYTKGKPIYLTTDKVNAEQARKINLLYWSGELAYKEFAEREIGLKFHIIDEYIKQIENNNPYGEFYNMEIPEGEVIAAFLNLRTPAVIKHDGSTIAHLSEQNRNIINNNTEGAIIENVNERTNYSGEAAFDLIGTDFIVFNPNQIKSATDNVGTYSEESTIYLEAVPDVNNRKKDSFLQSLKQS